MFLKKIRSLFAVLAAFTLVGCATVGRPASPLPIEKSRTFDAPFDAVWPAIIGCIAESNLKITTLEKDSGIIAIGDATYSPTDADEGGRGSVLGVPDRVMNRVASFNIFATRPSLDQTTVRVNTDMKMYIRSGNGSQAFPFQYHWEAAYSNGNIEQFLLADIARRINHVGAVINSYTNTKGREEDQPLTKQPPIESKAKDSQPPPKVQQYKPKNDPNFFFGLEK